MFARVARYQFPEESLDDAVESFREAVEKLRGIEGNTGGYLLVDRDNCTALTVTFWGGVCSEYEAKATETGDRVKVRIVETNPDPERVCIYGGSYGGYATLVSLTFTPETFACGVDYVGPSSLVTLINSFPAYWRPFLEGTFYRHVGNPENLDDIEHVGFRKTCRY